MSKKELWRKKKYPLIIFNSTQEAIAGEKILEENKIDCLIIPTPRELSNGCGLSLRIAHASIPITIRTMKEKAMNGTLFLWEESQGIWKPQAEEESSKGYLSTAPEK
ncbi:DUF3343 domain-containing protein [Heliorestis acidaminivorans]|uniref:DUF3343 domain-containing protein n=1 Tax=Heliorestis acidaminivorans TaxID=553427 RepID=A0A6I0EU64_9FIRM|nr:DUF3343 domain-containing protein [Heliorestis acidaminivorans]KAB2954325.1 DUF3343 domain-containing protein [Heliorestis acidaminivorans]